MSKLTDEIDAILDEFGCEPDPRLESITHEEFERHIERMNEELEKEFEEIERERAQTRIDFYKSGEAYILYR